MKKFRKLLIAIVLFIVLIVLIIFARKHQTDTVSGNISGVIINEIMSKNDGICPDRFGDFHDWIELYNSSSRSVDISGCGLSDDITSKVKYVFPKGTVLSPGAYYVVYCSGEKTADDYAEFKLSSSDEVVLFDMGGKQVESISIRKSLDGKSLARVSPDSNSWIDYTPTPGFSNDEQGAAAYAESIKDLLNGQTANTNGDILISELMASNATVIACADGNFYDWVELYNQTDKSINLNGWSVSDDTNNITKYTFTDDIIIESHGYLLIFCSGQSGIIQNEVHVPFGLRAYEECFVIADKNAHVSDKLTFKNQKTDISIARGADGVYKETSDPTPGFANTEEGLNEFLKTALVPNSPVYITELMGANSTVLFNVGNTKIAADFIELYNSSDEDINLSGYCLSNKPTNPGKWAFPDVTIKSGEYLTVLAGLDDTQSKQAEGRYLSVNFSISSLGETVYLFNPEGKFQNKLCANNFIKEMSVGLSKDYTLLYYQNPTPGKRNSTSNYYFGQTEMPVFKTLPGIYDDEITVEITGKEGEKIYYTTDCSVPTEKSTLYTGPITVSKNTVIRAKSFKSKYYNNFSCTSGTFLFKSDDCNHTLPVLTLVTDKHNLWDSKDGIYAYGDTVNFEEDTWPYWQTNANFWADVEVPASFELFDENGKQAFQQNIGIKISGAFGQGREQKGFAITARDEYGKSRMEYKFFKDLPYTEYKSILLRCGAQDQLNAKIKDVVTADLLKGSDVNFLYQDYKPYILYLNGRYWGVYFLREKRTRFFVAQHEDLGLDNADNLTLIKSETRANYGSTAEWKALMDFARNNDLTKDSNYKYLTDRLDIDSFIDYMICEIYIAQTDYWNIQMYKTAGGKWRFIYYDFCWSFTNYEHKTVAARRHPSQPCSDLFNACLKRKDFRDKFLRRFGVILNTVFTEERCLSSIEKLYNAVKGEIERERSIFNSSPSAYKDLMPYIDPQNISSYSHFEKEVEKMRTFAKKRRDELISQLKEEFSLSDSYIKEVFGNG